MTKKQFFAISLIICLPLVLAGCSFRKSVPISQTDDGGYAYSADDLGFALKLSKEFQYFQTQRKNLSDHTDVEFFVPTSDTGYPQDVPGYGTVMVIRMSSDPQYQPEKDFIDLGAKGDRHYWVLFWNRPPTDWSDKWSDTMKQQIIDSFKKN